MSHLSDQEIVVAFLRVAAYRWASGSGTRTAVLRLADEIALGKHVEMLQRGALDDAIRNAEGYTAEASAAPGEGPLRTHVGHWQRVTGYAK